MKAAIAMLEQNPQIPSANYQRGETYQMWATNASRLKDCSRKEIEDLFLQAAEAYKLDFDMSRRADSLNHLKSVVVTYDQDELPSNAVEP